MKVLNLINAHKPFLMDQIDALEEAGVECDTICVPGDFHANDSDFTSRSPIDYLKFYPKVLSHISSDYDVIHAHYGLTAPFALAQPHRPVVLSLWGRDLFGPAAPVTKACAKLCGEVIVRSEEMREELGQPAHIVERGVDLEKFRPMDQEQAREKVNWSNKRKHVIFPYSPQRDKKNYQLAEEVIEEVKSIADENVALHAIYNEPHKKIPVYLNASDLLLMTSRPKSEGSPNTVKEALACNTPVVSTNVGDVSNLIGDVSGYHICNNKEEIVKSTAEVLRSGDTVNGRIRARDLSWSRTTDSIIDIYKKSI
ncbi:glycosyltransferase [Halorubrum ezzemoulense]|uniref:glycosyltransferase n=1 Tax=Halorubrum ezzemoulense TaxID=337243 RepID=UPI00232C7400|nr:glycosyltransferase [Halorubrum ezzemoulense]MDB2252500.1 glycosyltransferase [Halorubrum ezzemoulense]